MIPWVSFTTTTLYSSSSSCERHICLSPIVISSLNKNNEKSNSRIVVYFIHLPPTFNVICVWKTQSFLLGRRFFLLLLCFSLVFLFVFHRFFRVLQQRYIPSTFSLSFHVQACFDSIHFYMFFFRPAIPKTFFFASILFFRLLLRFILLLLLLLRFIFYCIEARLYWFMGI